MGIGNGECNTRFGSAANVLSLGQSMRSRGKIWSTKDGSCVQRPREQSYPGGSEYQCVADQQKCLNTNKYKKGHT